MPARRLTTKRVEKPWGRHDLWPGFPDAAADGEKVGEVWFEAPGDPELLVKYLFTSQKLSIQDHPDDAYARAHGYKRGKDEAWVILSAEPHATIGIGMLQPMTHEELRAAALDGSIDEKMDWKAVKAGDTFYSPAGTVHAIGPGLTLVEIQQNVDLTYRLYDYGSGRELHLDDGIAVSNPVPFVAPHVTRDVAPGRAVLADGPAFVMERWTFAGTGTLSPERDRPAWLVPLAGGGTIDGETLEAGGVWLTDGASDVVLKDGSDMLVAYPGHGVAGDIWR